MNPVEIHCCESKDNFHDLENEPNLGWDDDEGTHYLVLFMVVANHRVHTQVTRKSLEEILANNVDEEILIKVSPCPKCAIKGITGPRYDLQFERGDDS